jgi:hypothetical protein
MYSADERGSAATVPRLVRSGTWRQKLDHRPPAGRRFTRFEPASGQIDRERRPRASKCPRTRSKSTLQVRCTKRARRSWMRPFAARPTLQPSLWFASPKKVQSRGDEYGTGNGIAAERWLPRSKKANRQGVQRRLSHFIYAALPFEDGPEPR